MTTDTNARPRRRRWRISQSIVEMHYELRTEADTPVRQALSVWLGVLIGCTPFWGVHLLICAALAKPLGLPRVKCILAAHINNPVTAPFLLYAQALIGHWLFTQEWLSLSLEEVRGVGILSLGRDILLGSFVVGVVLGAALAAVAFVISMRWREAPLRTRLKEETAKKFRDAGVFNWEFVRGRLRHDPIYYHLIVSGDLPREGHLLDLGCGHGILLALIASAKSIREQGDWPADAPPPPAGLTLTGVESNARRGEIARLALGDDAQIEVTNLAHYDPPGCRAVVLLDVLHHMRPDEQVALLQRCASALEPGGVLFLREQNAAAGLRFLLKRAGLRLWAIARGEQKSRMHFRDLGEWLGVLRECGLSPEVHPIFTGKGQPSALVVARKAEVSHDRKESPSVRDRASGHRS